MMHGQQNVKSANCLRCVAIAGTSYPAVQQHPISLYHFACHTPAASVFSDFISYLSLQRRYSPGWASASFKSFLYPSRFRATTFQFLHPSLATSSSTPSSQRSLGLPLGCFPPGSLRKSVYIYIYIFFLFWPNSPPVGQGLLIHEVCTRSG